MFLTPPLATRRTKKNPATATAPTFIKATELASSSDLKVGRLTSKENAKDV
jgi:hypothetical protein